MSEAIPDNIRVSLAKSDRDAYFEQLLFVRSPFGTAVTTLCILGFLVATLALALLLSGNAMASGGGVLANPHAPAGLWLCLLAATVLGMQRYARSGDRRDIGSFVIALDGDWRAAADITELTPRGAPLASASLLGIGGGLLASWLLYVAPNDNLRSQPALLGWFVLLTTLIFASFFRGVVLTRTGSESFQRTLSAMTIDLLRVDRLAVIGRAAARIALIWFTIGAVTLLAFVGGGVTILTLAFMLCCIAMGAWSFIGTMERVHRRILAAKRAELERIRDRIDELRRNMHEDAEAATKLQGALAYEARIAAVHEWPFDQPTLLRVGASALILTVPWFGQAIAGVVVDRLGSLMH